MYMYSQQLNPDWATFPACLPAPNRLSYKPALVIQKVIQKLVIKKKVVSLVIQKVLNY